MSFDTCNQQISDCGQNYSPIGTACFKNSPDTDPNCLQFNWVPYNSKYWLNKSVVDNVPVTECIRTCALDTNCDAAKYDFDKGSCELVYQNPSPDPILPKEENPSSCVGLYEKTSSSSAKKCVSINKKDGSNLTIDLDKYIPAVTIPKVASDYQGVDCRKYASSRSLDITKYNDGLQAFADWCTKNPEIDTCRSFCENDNYASFCKPPFPKLMILYISIVSVSLFGAIAIYTKKYNTSRVWKGIFGLCIIMLILFGVLSIWKGVQFSQHAGTYSGTTPDFTNPSMLPRNCTEFRYDCTVPEAGLSHQCTINSQNPEKGIFSNLQNCQNSSCLNRVKYNTGYYIFGTNGKTFCWF